MTIGLHRQPRARSAPSATSRPSFTIMYHSVEDDAHDPYQVCVSPERFRRHMRLLSRWGLRGVSMRELVEAHRSGTAAGLVGLTFDDGYRTVVDIAAPILQDFGFTATVFVVCEQLGGTNVWDQPGRARPLLDTGDLAELVERGFEIGSHGASHLSLRGRNESVLDSEVLGSREHLGQITTINGFCYPYGDVDAASMAAVAAAGYDYACAVKPGALSSRFALPRRFLGDGDGGLRLRGKRAVHAVRTPQISWDRP